MHTSRFPQKSRTEPLSDTRFLPVLILTIDCLFVSGFVTKPSATKLACSSLAVLDRFERVVFWGYFHSFTKKSNMIVPIFTWPTWCFQMMVSRVLCTCREPYPIEENENCILWSGFQARWHEQNAIHWSNDICWNQFSWRNCLELPYKKEYWFLLTDIRMVCSNCLVLVCFVTKPLTNKQSIVKMRTGRKRVSERGSVLDFRGNRDVCMMQEKWKL